MIFLFMSTYYYQVASHTESDCLRFPIILFWIGDFIIKSERKSGIGNEFFPLLKILIIKICP